MYTIDTNTVRLFLISLFFLLGNGLLTVSAGAYNKNDIMHNEQIMTNAKSERFILKYIKGITTKLKVENIKH